jgi:hypothetical protein
MDAKEAYLELGKFCYNDAIMKRFVALVEYAEFYAMCPCCEKIDVCVEGCTFAEDCPKDQDRLVNARYSLGYFE